MRPGGLDAALRVQDGHKGGGTRSNAAALASRTQRSPMNKAGPRFKQSANGSAMVAQMSRWG